MVGALLAFAALDLALGRRMLDARKDCRPVIGVAAAATLLAGPPAGLVAGLLAESLRRQRAARNGRCSGGTGRH